MLDLFRDDNTTGYTPRELETLNAEWAAKVDHSGLEEHTDEYNEAADMFCDSVSKSTRLKLGLDVD